MPQNLFAACRNSQNNLTAKRVRLNANVQQQVEAIFASQETAFRVGITNEVPFDGSWKPDEDEFLTIGIPAEAQVIVDAITANATAIPDVNTATFTNEGIKALFTGMVLNGSTKILVQRFTSQQILERRFALLQDGNAFRHLSEPAFTLDGGLACIIETGLIKFKSQSKLRSIINMVDIYRAATDQEIQTFASHANLHVSNINSFVQMTNQVSRKLIHAISNNGTLDNYTSVQIQSAAAQTGLTINLNNGRLVVPGSHHEIKSLLQFLNESRYSGPLSGQAYVTNSQRPA